VEFLDKSVAKTVAGMLNAEVIGGKKGDRQVGSLADLVKLLLMTWLDGETIYGQ
jgi:hypothetical protein